MPVDREVNKLSYYLQFSKKPDGEIPSGFLCMRGNYTVCIVWLNFCEQSGGGIEETGWVRYAEGAVDKC